MRASARRRLLIALLVSWPLAFVWFGWIGLTVYSLLDYYRTSFATCGGGGISGLNVPGLLSGCESSFSPAIAIVEALFMVAVAVVVAALVSRWVLAPVRAMADIVEQLGPTSLGLRLRQDGPRDEARQLADAIDALLDRVAEGYEAQRRFASNASHELRTPLATQRALIEVSLREALDPAQLELLSRQLLATNERNERLIDGLLTLAETDQGLVGQRKLQLERIVDDALDLLRAAAKEREIDLDVSTSPTPVLGERALLERLVVNLVQNAIKYNVDGGWLRVTVANGVLVVANSGASVPPEQVAGLFEPFRRVGGERLDHGGGVGLGLTIARSIVSAHSGEIAAIANPDGGLTVEVRLPPQR